MHVYVCVFFGAVKTRANDSAKSQNLRREVYNLKLSNFYACTYLHTKTYTYTNNKLKVVQ